MSIAARNRNNGILLRETAASPQEAAVFYCSTKIDKVHEKSIDFRCSGPEILPDSVSKKASHIKKTNMF